MLVLLPNSGILWLVRQGAAGFNGPRSCRPGGAAGVREATYVALEVPRLQDFLSRPLSTLELVDPTLVSPSDRLGDVVAVMRERRDSCALVVDGAALRGIVTERDVLCRFMEPSIDWSDPVGSVMTVDPETLNCEEPIGRAVDLLNERDFRTLPILEDGSVRGLVRLGDLLRHIAELFPEEILNLPPRPDQRMAKPEGG
jgi:CBS domain-containing protein